MTIWRTCKHCKSHFEFPLPDNWDSNSSSISDFPNVYCTMCNMNTAGDTKDKGIRKTT